MKIMVEGSFNKKTLQQLDLQVVIKSKGFEKDPSKIFIKMEEDVLKVEAQLFEDEIIAMNFKPLVLQTTVAEKMLPKFVEVVDEIIKELFSKRREK